MGKKKERQTSEVSIPDELQPLFAQFTNRMPGVVGQGADVVDRLYETGTFAAGLSPAQQQYGNILQRLMEQRMFPQLNQAAQVMQPGPAPAPTALDVGPGGAAGALGDRLSGAMGGEGSIIDRLRGAAGVGGTMSRSQGDLAGAAGFLPGEGRYSGIPGAEAGMQSLMPPLESIDITALTMPGEARPVEALLRRPPPAAAPGPATPPAAAPPAAVVPGQEPMPSIDERLQKARATVDQKYGKGNKYYNSLVYQEMQNLIPKRFMGTYQDQA